MEISLNAIIDRVQLQFAELYAQKEAGSEESGLDGRIRMLEDKLEDREWLSHLVRISLEELPEPKPRKKKGRSR